MPCGGARAWMGARNAPPAPAAPVEVESRLKGVGDEWSSRRGDSRTGALHVEEAVGGEASLATLHLCLVGLEDFRVKPAVQTGARTEHVGREVHSVVVEADLGEGRRKLTVKRHVELVDVPI